MIDFQIGNLPVQTIYGAVRVFGQSAWNENQRLTLQVKREFRTVFRMIRELPGLNGSKKRTCLPLKFGRRSAVVAPERPRVLRELQ